MQESQWKKIWNVILSRSCRVKWLGVKGTTLTGRKSITFGKECLLKQKVEIYNTLLIWMDHYFWPKEYVAVSIDICPWQNFMQLGIKFATTNLGHWGHVYFVNFKQSLPFFSGKATKIWWICANLLTSTVKIDSTHWHTFKVTSHICSKNDHTCTIPLVT